MKLKIKKMKYKRKMKAALKKYQSNTDHSEKSYQYQKYIYYSNKLRNSEKITK